MAERTDVGNVAIIRTSPDEDRIKKYVIAGVENLALLLKEIFMNIQSGRLDYDVLIEFKAEVINLYYYYARPKIKPHMASMSEQDKAEKRYEELYGLDYYILNPTQFSLEFAVYFAQMLREFFEDLGLFQIETVKKTN